MINLPTTKKRNDWINLEQWLNYDIRAEERQMRASVLIIIDIFKESRLTTWRDEWCAPIDLQSFSDLLRIA